MTCVCADRDDVCVCVRVRAEQEVMWRMGRWSLNYDCRELRILVDAWKREIAQVEPPPMDDTVAAYIIMIQ
eukprot:832718-Rhodomonas_salina.2